MGYISLDQARVLAIEHARDNTDFYGPNYAGMNLVWEMVINARSNSETAARTCFVKFPSGESSKLSVT